MALAAIPGGWLSDRFGYRIATIIGLGMALVGFFLVFETWTLELSDTVIALQMILIGVGIGLTFGSARRSSTPRPKISMGWRRRWSSSCG